ncbi:PqqD family protein [Streptomyces durhamensis]|uniref:PqqD family protein n=1 Tax=Streptomyces durhamensis TaxID=68194 RepID=UPI003CC91A50
MVLCRLDTAEFFELNHAGAIVWRSCGQGFDAIYSALQHAFPEVSPGRLLADGKACITSLVDAGLLHRGEDGNSVATR